VRYSFARYKKAALIAFVSLASLVAVFSFVDVHKIGSVLSETDPSSLVIALLLILTSNLLALLRFRAVLQILSFRPRARDLFFAFSLGQVSSQFILSVLGQSVTRAVALVRAGIPFGATITATYIERLLAAGILFALSVAGLFVLLHRFAFDLQQGGGYLLTSIGAIFITFGVTAYAILHPDRRTNLLDEGSGWMRRLGSPAVFTLLSHTAMLAAYAVILSAFDYHGRLFYTAAALTIVMFAASLPVSFAGWGVRELSAATALSIIGCPPATAIAAGLVIGALSLVVMTGVAGLGLLLNKRTIAAPDNLAVKPVREYANWDIWLAQGCAVFCAVAVFFQLRVPIGNGNLTFNLGDVGAVTGLSLAALLIGTRRISVPFSKPVIWILAIVSALLLYGIAVAYLHGHLGKWALINRGVGWFVILGYIITAATTVSVGGERGLLLILKSFATAGVTICIIQLAMWLFSVLLYPLPRDVLPFPLEGFAGNQNAFVLQLVMVALALILLLQRNAIQSRWLFSLCFGFIAAAMYYAKSRTGLIFLGAMTMGMVWLTTTHFFEDTTSRRQIREAALVIACVVGLAILLPYIIYVGALVAREIVSFISADHGIFIDPDNLLARLSTADRLGIRIVHEQSGVERWQTIVDGLNIWRHYPIFGGGLGAFVEWRLASGMGFQVIHSTPVWILAEFGVVGAVAAGIALLCIKHFVGGLLAEPRLSPYGLGVSWLLLFTGAGGLVHDLFFQRVFWILFGLFSAVHLLRECSGRAEKLADLNVQE
jgi:uncharacterized membrane protein YbhN (UPF0104 family)